MDRNTVTMEEHLPRLLYIAGCDGTGKTTQSGIFLRHWQSNGVKAVHRWLRFPFFFSLPFLIYARIRKFSWYETSEGNRFGYWDFRRSWMLRTLFPWFFLADGFLAGVWGLRLPLWFGRRVVCERFSLDMLADLTTAFHNAGFVERLPGRLFPRLIPGKSASVLLDLDSHAILQRRPSLANDRNLLFRLSVYRTIAEKFGIPVIRTETDETIVHRQLVDVFSRPEEKYKVYAKVRSPLLRKILSFPIIALSSHWVFQSFFYMGWSERIFKIALEGFFVGLFWGVEILWFRGIGSWILPLILAHTMNFLLNGHIWGVLKFYGYIRQSREKYIIYKNALEKRIQGEPSILEGYLIGSEAQGTWTPASDLDIRLLRNAGIANALRACFFGFAERTRAMLSRFPLDLYIADSNGALRRMHGRRENILPFKEKQ